MANNEGHIKLFRSIEDWEWIDDPVMFYFWVRILLMANWEERRWHGETVGRGSFVTSLSSLSKRINLSVRQIRTCLGRLENDKQIVIETTSKRTKVTICKYDDYQGCATSKRQTNDTQPDKRTTTTKEEYNTSDTKVSSYSIQEEKKDKDTVVSPKKETIDYDSIKNIWNESMTRKVPKIVSISDARKEKIRLRVAEMGGWIEAQDIIRECLRKINESDFCNGENGNKWVATFDWFFVNEKNWVKVLEGNYDNRKRKTSIDILQENIEKADAYYAQRYGYGGASAYGVPAGGRSDDPDEQ